MAPQAFKSRARMIVVEDPKNHNTFIGIRDAQKMIKKELRAALRAIGRENVRDLQRRIIDPPHSGRIYKIWGNLGFKHQASAPGQAPAERMGGLRRSVRYAMNGSYQMRFGETELYGKFLEDGTKKMDPRPHVKVTVEKRSGRNFEIIRNVARNFEKRLKAPKK